MNLSGECKLLKIYINEDSTYKGHNLYHALVFKLKEIGMAGVSVTRGIESYGRGKRLHSAHILDLSLNLPIVIDIVDTKEKIEMALPVIEEMVNEGLILLTDVNVIKYGRELTTKED